MDVKRLKTRGLVPTIAVGVGVSFALMACATLAQNQFNECGWMQRGERATDEPLTEQELIALREQEIEQLANQSEHCLAQSSGGAEGGQPGADGASGQSGASGQEGAGGQEGAASDNGSGGEDAGTAPTQTSSANQASSNVLAEGETSVASSVPKGTHKSLPTGAASTVNNGANAQSSSAQDDQTETGTGIGAPRAQYATADNKERLRQQLKAKIAATDDPDLKKKLQERLDALK